MWPGRKVQDNVPRTCDAVREGTDDVICICFRERHDFTTDHQCPCGLTWPGDPNGPDFIRLE